MASRQDKSKTLRLWWLGQSGYLVQFQSRHLLIDPYLSDSLTTKYAATDKPHVRMSRRVIDPARLDFIDALTASHQHTDHLDPPTLRALVAANPRIQIVAPAAHADLAAERTGLPVKRLHLVNDGDELSLANKAVTLTALPSAHDQLERDAAGNHKFLGYIFRAGPWIIYHSGDTVRYIDLAERLRTFHLDLAILPINGKVGNMNGTDAAYLAHDVSAKLVLPCHYDMFEFNTADP